MNFNKNNENRTTEFNGGAWRDFYYVSILF
jgi:hypothetical protein